MYGRLALCVTGIYVFYLSWGILQEKLTTQEYVHGETRSKFKYFIFLNLCQCVGAALISFIFLQWEGSGLGRPSLGLLKDYLKCSISHTLASPFGYESLKHINYPTMILGKSCKLVPVMLMNFVVYRKRFEPYKYVTVLLITLGVSGFMLFEPHSSNRTKAVEQVTNSLYGLSLLLINLLIDGATNSWQDQIFLHWKVKSQQMMFFMNAFGAILMLIWLLNPLNTELSHAIQFCTSNPSVITDLILFSICSAMGQNFIFYTLEKFGSLSLVTVTVTRKLFTILISLFYFDHHLNVEQWMCVLFVFAALGIETYFKRPISTKPPVKKIA